MPERIPVINIDFVPGESYTFVNEQEHEVLTVEFMLEDRGIEVEAFDTDRNRVAYFAVDHPGFSLKKGGKA